MIRSLYNWTMSLAGHPHAMTALAVISFIESSIFPIPPDVLIIAMVLATPERAWRIAMVAGIASVAGGFAGYGIGYFLYEALGRDIIGFYGYEQQFESFKGLYAEWGFWIVAGAGFTPFPYKVITIASGAADLNLFTFGVASTVSRFARFLLVAALLWKFGPPMRLYIEKYLNLLTVAFFALLIGSFLLIKWLA
ncbi:MAG: YqaA family protein [Rhodospirillaceae bacterium]|nr:YqaA family protein [Rhodospirillaceae bacterium]